MIKELKNLMENLDETRPAPILPRTHTIAVKITKDSTLKEAKRIRRVQESRPELTFAPLKKGESLEFTGKIRHNTYLYEKLSELDIAELKDIKKTRSWQ